MQVKFKMCLEFYMNLKMLENAFAAIPQCKGSYRINFDFENIVR